MFSPLMRVSVRSLGFAMPSVEVPVRIARNVLLSAMPFMSMIVPNVISVPEVTFVRFVMIVFIDEHRVRRIPVRVV